MQDIVRVAPKVELHVHLDGAFNLARLFEHGKRLLAELPEGVQTLDGKTLPVRKNVADCEGLEQFEKLVTMGESRGLLPMLDCFYTFLPIVRGRFDIVEELSYEFCRSQAAHNVIYTEVRYSPHELLPQEEGVCVSGFAPADAVKAVCRGVERGEKEFNITVRQILCCIASQPSWSAETAALAKQFAGQVVAIDVASGEMHFESEALSSAHKAALDSARAAGIAVIVHAGEVGPSQNVALAMEKYGAQRIGHGYSALGTEVYAAAKAKGVHFELCPTSSQLTGAATQEWGQHPVATFIKDPECSCSINTDDPSVFQTNLTRELVLCVEKLGATLKDVERLTQQAVSKAFVSDAVREELAQAVATYYAAL